jgi:hypothetical protein
MEAHVTDSFSAAKTVRAWAHSLRSFPLRYWAISTLGMFRIFHLERSLCDSAAVGGVFAGFVAAHLQSWLQSSRVLNLVEQEYLFESKSNHANGETKDHTAQ